MALEILGRERVFGPEKVREVFGIDVEKIPDISYSEQELKAAKEAGDALVLRVDRFDQDTPFTLKELVRRKQEHSELLLSDQSDISDELDWVSGMKFQEQTTPILEWKLVRTKPLEETKHLSFEAQKAFLDKDQEALQNALEEMSKYWDELLSDQKNGWLRESVETARASLPTVEALMNLRASLPEHLSLPTVVEAIYDSQIKGQLFENMAVATADTVEPFDDEPERPIDLSFVDGKASLHIRRDKRFGRPHKLGKSDDFVSGIPIGYFQY